MKKKSYMNIKNILNEGILDFISNLIIKGKVKSASKLFKNDKRVTGLLHRIDKNYDELAKILKRHGVDMKEKPRLANFKYKK